MMAFFSRSLKEKERKIPFFFLLAAPATEISPEKEKQGERKKRRGEKEK